MKFILLPICLLTIIFSVPANAQNAHSKMPLAESPMPMKPKMTEILEPEVAIVTPAKVLGDAPSDAIILLTGKNLDQWVSEKDNIKPASWKIVHNNHIEFVPGSGGISTKMKFGDCQVHFEFSAPDTVQGDSQGRGNSGLFFQNRYELQILYSHNNRTSRNGQAGRIYKDYAPLVNAMGSPIEWNSYNIIYSPLCLKKMDA